jgi:hypothetical protein
LNFVAVQIKHCAIVDKIGDEQGKARRLTRKIKMRAEIVRREQRPTAQRQQCVARTHIHVVLNVQQRRPLPWPVEVVVTGSGPIRAGQISRLKTPRVAEGHQWQEE